MRLCPQFLFLPPWFSKLPKFGRLEDWRRVAMRHDCCVRTLFAAIVTAGSANTS